MVLLIFSISLSAAAVAAAAVVTSLSFPPFLSLFFWGGGRDGGAGLDVRSVAQTQKRWRQQEEEEGFTYSTGTPLKRATNVFQKIIDLQVVKVKKKVTREFCF